MSKEEIFKELRNSLENFDVEATVRAAKEVMEKKYNVIKASNILIDAIGVVGEKFEKMEVFLPEMMLAANAMKKALKVMEPELRRKKDQLPSLGKVVLGTVTGDVHDIGKNLVSAMLLSSGFEVIDIGVNVPAKVFLKVAEREQADIVAASALMTTTKPFLKDLVEYFKAVGVREKYIIIVGGSPVTKEWADEIGADGYSKDAVEAAKVARELVAIK